MMKVVAFGNPLLDTIVLLKDDNLLKKYKLEIDGQKELSQDQIKLMKEDIKSYEKTITAGGCAQNTLKVLRWLLERPCSTVMFGAVGADDEGTVLRNLLREQGVETSYIIHQGRPTGSSVALVNGDKRSLVAHLGAAEEVSVEEIKSSRITEQIASCQLIYMEGFFLTKRVEAARFVLDTCNSLKKVVAFNLCGEYLCNEYPETVSYFVHNSAIIFGNMNEFSTLCSFLKEGDVESFIKKLGAGGRLVVVTNGASSVLCASRSDYFAFDVPFLPSGEIVDTTGAGDSFVAGFLCGYLLKKCLKVCVEWGCYAAQEIIKQKGCAVPGYSPCLYSRTDRLLNGSVKCETGQL